jgi:hypothetical protein
MIIELQPKFDYSPHWTKIADGAWVPDVDGATGLQHVTRVALPTAHQIYWPGDESVSQISAVTWLSITQSVDITGHYWFNGTSFDGNGVPNGAPLLKDGPIVNKRDLEWNMILPKGTRKISINLAPHENPIAVTLEVKAR